MEKKKEVNDQPGYDSEGRLFGEFKNPSYDEWKEAAVKLLKGKPFEKAMFTKTDEGILLKPIYNQDDLENLPHIDSLPGFFPYLRGTEPEGHLTKPWDICQEIYAGDPFEFNATLEEALYKGQTALKMTLDMPTQMGLDPDHEEAEEVGVRGVSLSTLSDMNKALHDLIFSVLPVQVTIGMNPVPMFSLLTAYLEESNQSIQEVKGVFGYDPLGMLAKHGQLNTTLDRAYDAMKDVTQYALEKKSELRTILVEGHPYHDGGADTIQELAYAMATGTAYIRAMMDRGMNIDDVAKRMAFSLSLGSNFFMELSKVRAARVVWAKIVKAFGGSESAQKIYIHGKTSSWTKTVYDPYVNMLRNASEAFSGAVAGVDSLDVVPFDEPIREADEFSRRVSRNVQSILQDECRFTQPIDPAGGSWYIESLTYEISEKVWTLFQDIEKEGMFKKLSSGEIKTAVADKYNDKFKNMAKRKHVWVGTNKYANMTEEKIDGSNEKNIKPLRVKHVQEHRLNADVFQVEESLSQLGDHYMLTGELSIDKAVEAIKHGATLGDISEICNRHVKEVATVEAVVPERGAERFEALRDRTNEMKKEGNAPSVFLFNYGKIPKHKARADFSTGFFEVGGFEVLKNNGFMNVEDAVKAGLESGAPIGVICSTDDVYPEIVPEIAKQVRDLGSNMKLVVAGRPPKELQEAYMKAGVDHFIYMGANCYDLLSELQKEVK